MYLLFKNDYSSQVGILTTNIIHVASVSALELSLGKYSVEYCWPFPVLSPGFFIESRDRPFTPYFTLPLSHGKEGSKNII